MSVPAHAFALVVWGPVKYLIGALATAHSLRRVGTRADIVLLYADMQLPDSLLDCGLFDHIQQVQLWRIRVNPLRTERQRQLYGGEFSETANTKWWVLTLTQYSKVCYVDSDIVFQHCPDAIFQLRTPAACFSSPYAQPFVRRGIRNLYGALEEGDVIAPQRVVESLTGDGLVGSGAVVLLEPNTQVSEAFVNFVHQHEPYGHARSYSAIDEQSLCEFYARRGVLWTHMSCGYQVIPWKLAWWSRSATLRDAPGLHYYHDKPWQKGQAEGWEDTQIWWNIYADFERTYPQVALCVKSFLETSTPLSSH